MIDFLRAILTCQVLWSIFLDRNCSGANKKKKKLFPEEIYLLINASYFSRYSLRSYSRLTAHPVRELCSSGFVAPDSVRNKVNLVPHRWKSKLYSRPTAGEPLVSPGLKRHTPVRNKRILWYLTGPSSFSSARLGWGCWVLTQAWIWMQKSHKVSINSTEYSSFPTADFWDTDLISK